MNENQLITRVSELSLNPAEQQVIFDLYRGGRIDDSERLVAQYENLIRAKQDRIKFRSDIEKLKISPSDQIIRGVDNRLLYAGVVAAAVFLLLSLRRR